MSIEDEKTTYCCICVRNISHNRNINEIWQLQKYTTIKCLDVGVVIVKVIDVDGRIWLGIEKSAYRIDDIIIVFVYNNRIATNEK